MSRPYICKRPQIRRPVAKTMIKTIGFLHQRSCYYVTEPNFIALNIQLSMRIFNWRSKGSQVSLFKSLDLLDQIRLNDPLDASTRAYNNYTNVICYVLYDVVLCLLTFDHLTDWCIGALRQLG